MAKRQRTNNHLEIEVEDTTGAIRIRKSKKDRQHNGQKTKDKQPSRSRSKDTTGAIRIRKSKKDRQCSGQKKKIKDQRTVYKTLHMKLNIHQHDPPH